jgi:uncharacterized protein (TIGR03000 family)
MFRRRLTFGGVLVLAAVLALATTGPSQAAGRFGGGHFGGFHGGFNYGGFYHFRPYYGYGRYYHPYYGYYPYYYNSYPYGYGYYPYLYGYYPYDYGYSPYSSSYSDDGSWYPGSGNAYSPGITAAGFTSVSPLSGGAGEPAPSRQADTAAHVTVTVPPGADVWFDGSNTYSAGPVREFQSPPLTPGADYSYQIRARWKDDGREVTQTQQVSIAAGAHVRVQFPVPTKTTAQTSVTNGR